MSRTTKNLITLEDIKVALIAGIVITIVGGLYKNNGISDYLLQRIMDALPAGVFFMVGLLFVAVVTRILNRLTLK